MIFFLSVYCAAAERNPFEFGIVPRAKKDTHVPSRMLATVEFAGQRAEFCLSDDGEIACKKVRKKNK